MKRNAITMGMATVCFLSLPGLAAAQVTLTPGADADAFAGVLGKDVGTLQSELQTQVNNLFQVADVHGFLRDFQNAQSFSTKGLGVDYASEATLVEVGATLSLASNVDKAYKPSNSVTDPPIRGGGTNFSLMAGAGLGALGVPVMLFGNWFKGGASVGALSGDYQNWGIHGQLRLFGPSRSMSLTKVLIRWGGIALTTGADYSKTSLHYGKSIASSFDLVPNAPVTVKSDLTGNLRFNLEQTTWAIPLEITTSVRLLTILTIYGGLGFDWQLGGGSNLDIDMAANLSGKFNGVTYGDLGKATIKVADRADPSPARMREIIGVQLNMTILRLFVQANVTGSSPMLTSLAMGARIAI